MFLLVGKGTFLKENLISKLQEWGVSNAQFIVSEAEDKGQIRCGSHKILLVK